MRNVLSVVIVAALASGVVIRAQQTPVRVLPSGFIKSSVTLSGDLVARITVGPENVGVQLLQPIHPGETDHQPLSKMAVRVWLLRSDGTSAARKDIGYEGGSQVSGYYPGINLFGFEPVSPKDVAGIVVSVNGKLFAHEIKLTP